MRKSFLFTVLSVLCIKCSEQKRNRENEGKTVSEIYTPECLPNDTDRLVYRYQNDSHIFVGFDNLKKRKLFTISWKISENNKGRYTFICIYIPDGINQSGVVSTSLRDVETTLFWY